MDSERSEEDEPVRTTVSSWNSGSLSRSHFILWGHPSMMEVISSMNQ